MAFAIVLLLGPTEIEIERTIDLFESIRAHEADRVSEADIFIVNDANARAGELEPALGAFRQSVSMTNPLAGEHNHPLDKATAGMMCALAQVSRRGPYDFVLKVDTDALVINPFASQLAAYFDIHPRVGMAGSFLRFPDGSPRPGNEYWVPFVRRAVQMGFVRGGLSTQPSRLPSSVVRIMRRRRLLAAAQRQGYNEGEHVLGGSYALSRGVLERWRKRSLRRLIYLFEGTRLGEDVVVSLLVRWAGLELADCNLPGEIFGVWHRELRLPPETLVRQYAVVHSVKSGSDQNESELRRAFKRYREGV